jgi:hypothetical protein
MIDDLTPMHGSRRSRMPPISHAAALDAAALDAAALDAAALGSAVRTAHRTVQVRLDLGAGRFAERQEDWRQQQEKIQRMIGALERLVAACKDDERIAGRSPVRRPRTGRDVEP